MGRRGFGIMLAVVMGTTAGLRSRDGRAAEAPHGRHELGLSAGSASANVGVHLAQGEVYAAPGGAVVEEGTAYPATPPPDPIPESPPLSPGYGYQWINGYWDWTGVEWTWNSGFWMPRQAGVTFYAPRFVFLNGEPVYYRGYWVDPYGRREYGYGWRGAPPAAWRARPSVAPGYWRAQHSEGWRRYPGAPAVWRAPVRGEAYRGGGRPGEPFRGGARPVDERRAVVGRPGEPVRAEGFRGGVATHPSEAALTNRAAPMAVHPGAPASATHPAAPAPHPAAPAPHPASRKK